MNLYSNLFKHVFSLFLSAVCLVDKRVSFVHWNCEKYHKRLRLWLTFSWKLYCTSWLIRYGVMYYKTIFGTLYKNCTFFFSLVTLVHSRHFLDVMIYRILCAYFCTHYNTDVFIYIFACSCTDQRDTDKCDFGISG